MQKKEKNKVLGMIWKISKFITTLFLVIVTTIIVIQRVFNNNVSLLRYRIFTVATGSMEPEYKVLDMLFVKETEEVNIKVDDDVVYMGEEGDFAGKIITHRVINITVDEEGTAFTTKGTANVLSDPIIRYDQILGKVIYKSYVLSFINKIINNVFGLIFFIILPIIVLVVLEIIDYKQDQESEELVDEEE